MSFSIVKAFSVLCLAAGVLSSPLSSRQNAPGFTLPGMTFNNWGGLSSLSGFDNFYGYNNFYGSNNKQVVVVEQEKVCRVQEVTIIQQQLAILQEFSKRIILEQICDVETQVIVLQQFRGGLHQFHKDISRQSGRSIGYDQNISGLLDHILGQDGSLSSSDLGFSGSDIGKNLATPTGSNWNDVTSPKNLTAISQIIKGNGTTTSHN